MWSWAWWLAAPVVVTVVAALLTWRVGRHPDPAPPGTEESMRRHEAYLTDLGVAVSTARTLTEGAHNRPR